LLQLTSSGSITDSVNATRPNASVTVFGNATLIATNAITLNDVAEETLEVRGGALGGNFGHASFTSNSGGNITIGTLGTTNFQSLQFNTVGNVTIQEDSSTDLQGVSVVGSNAQSDRLLQLTSAGSITDSTNSSRTVSSVTVNGDATFTAANAITLNNQADETLEVRLGLLGGNFGHAAFRSTGGGNITIGTAGSTNFQSLQFNTTGSVTIQEDSNTDFANTSTAGSLSIVSSGYIRDVANASVTVTQNATFLATTNIVLGDNAGDVLNVGELASFTAPVSITIGPAGTANFGSISLFTNNTATVQEDSDSLWNTVNVSNLQFTSAGYIKNLLENSVEVANLATLVADKYIHLGRVDISRVDITARGVGDLDFTTNSASGSLSTTYLFQLNDVADAKGTSFLTNLPSFSGTGDYFVGKTSAQLLDEYSFQQNLDRAYGVFITNLTQLEVQRIFTQDPAVPGDLATARPNVYVETLSGDINITGGVTTQSSINQNGAIVMVAANNFNILPGGGLYTEQVGDALALQRIFNSTMTANAYNYDQLFGTYVTTKFLFPNNYPYLPGPLASKFHTIAMSFGFPGEIGFQIVVQYGDAGADWPVGVVRTFSDTGDVAGSNLFPSGGPVRPIVSHVESLGGVATFVRNSSTESPNYYYTENYLTQNPLVNSTVILRRSTDFFLFEDGGATDVATVVDETTIVDNSLSLSGTVNPPSMPMPIEAPPFVFIEPPQAEFVPFEVNFTAQNVDYDEPRTILQGEVEVAIYKVRFDDGNENGQVDEGEEPTADQILDVKQKRIMPESKDVKGPVAPDQNQIRQWQTEYEEDPTKTAGVYAVIGTDRIRGQVVFGTFILRDTGLDTNETDKDVEIKPNNPQPEDGAFMDVMPQNWLDAVQHAWSSEIVQTGSMWLKSVLDAENVKKSAAEGNEVSQSDSSSGDNSEVTTATIAAGSALWLQRFRARNEDEQGKLDFSRAARRRRSYGNG
jgi:hypothetical protein